MQKQKGSVLVQVLLTAVIASIIAAGMMSLILLRAQAIKHAAGGAAGGAMTTAGLNDVLSAWTNSNGSCGTPVPGWSYSAGGGPCQCSYSLVTSNASTVINVTPGANGACNFGIVATPPP